MDENCDCDLLILSESAPVFRAGQDEWKGTINHHICWFSLCPDWQLNDLQLQFKVTVTHTHIEGRILRG